MPHISRILLATAVAGVVTVTSAAPPSEYPALRLTPSLSATDIAGVVSPSPAPSGEPLRDIPPREASYDFRTLGLAQPVNLRGIDNSLYLPIGVRRDEVVEHARLTLRYAWSPAMLANLTQLRISLNGETVGTATMPSENPGTEQVWTLDIDPRYFSDYNQLRLQFIGHYTEKECEDPLHSSLWLTISPDSRLDLQLQTIALPDELALLPAPFFDPRDGRKLDLPFVFARQPDFDTLRAAGKLASWFGEQAAWRGARFPVSVGTLPDRNAVVFAVNGAAPVGLPLESVQQPTLRVLDHPTRPGVKLLVVQGADAAQLDDAVLGLALGQAVLTGPSAQITALKPPPRREPYDAPLWLRTDRPVQFGELVNDPSELQTSGLNAPPIRINMRVPPDLLAWQRDGVPIDLHYRYVAPVERDNSLLAVSINDEFVRSFRLLPDAATDKGRKLFVPLLDQDAQADNAGGRFEIPAFQVGADNQLQFRFSLDYHRKERCLSTSDQSYAAIDPASTIDLRDFPHYTSLPNLALFANAGFPFSRYADLSDTLVVLPDVPLPADIETMLYLLGRIGRQTGASAAQLRLMPASRLGKHVDADLLVIDGRRGRDLLREWQDDLPVRLDAGQRSFQPRAATGWFTFTAPQAEAQTDAGTVAIDARGGIAALLGFESPLHDGRSVIAVTATTPAVMMRVADVLDDGGRVRRVRGDTTLIRGDEVSSWRGGKTYDVGSRPWWLVIRMLLSRHPLLLVLFAIAAGLVCTFVLSAHLRERARRRLASGH